MMIFINQILIFDIFKLKRNVWILYLCLTAFAIVNLFLFLEIFLFSGFLWHNILWFLSAFDYSSFTGSSFSMWTLILNVEVLKA